MITIIRRSPDVERGEVGAGGTVCVLSEIQARAILDMPLRRLTSLETTKLRDEHAALQTLIGELGAILADPARQADG